MLDHVPTIIIQHAYLYSKLTRNYSWRKPRNNLENRNHINMRNNNGGIAERADNKCCIDTETKWPSIYRWYYYDAFSRMKIFVFWFKFHQGPISNKPSLVRRQAIISNNDSPVYRRLYATLGLDELTQEFRKHSSFGPHIRGVPNSSSLLWRHNGRDCLSNHQPHDCLLNHLFRRRSKKISKLRVTGLCAGNSPGTGEFPAQMASNAENVSISWRHHVAAPTDPKQKWNVNSHSILT